MAAAGHSGRTEELAIAAKGKDVSYQIEARVALAIRTCTPFQDSRERISLFFRPLRVRRCGAMCRALIQVIRTGGA